MKLNLLAQKLQELNKGGTFLHVPKQLLLRCLQETQGGSGWTDAWIRPAASLTCTHLAKLLINDSKLKVVADHVLIKGDNEPRCLKRREQRGGGAVQMLPSYSPDRRLKEKSYLWVKNGVKSVHIHLFTNKLMERKKTIKLSCFQNEMTLDDINYPPLPSEPHWETL